MAYRHLSVLSIFTVWCLLGIVHGIQYPTLRGRVLAVLPVIADSWQEDLLTAVNAERSNAGLPTLCMNDKLTNAAQKHTTDMAQNNLFTHDGSDLSTPATRVMSEGFQYSAVAENIAAGQQSVVAVMDSWMRSPGHKANILGDYQYLGVGLAQNPKSEYGTYWTLTFGSSLSESCACILQS